MRWRGATRRGPSGMGEGAPFGAREEREGALDDAGQEEPGFGGAEALQARAQLREPQLPHVVGGDAAHRFAGLLQDEVQQLLVDRKSTRLNSSHTVISYAVFCLKKKTRITKGSRRTC